METNSHQIATVEEGSYAKRVGLCPGDRIVKINGVVLEDIFDYHYYSDDADLVLTVERCNGATEDVEVHKEIGEDLGIIFENGLMDDYKSCHNKCMFCFIDQMPPGMRDTLYFKDDDTRLSFLQGNYVTLTNMKEKDMQRIISYHLAPINISVHATNPELRCKMLNNRFAGDIIDKIKLLYDAGIEMNAQIVLCKGVNDGEELERSIRELLQFYPYMQSLSVVPVGLSKYRKGLYPLESFEKEDAIEVLRIIHKWQDISMKDHGKHFVQAGDEWYLLADMELPAEERYDGFIQLENGVGMIRLLINEFEEALEEECHHLFMRKKTISIATGKLAAPFIRELCDKLQQKFPKVTVQVYPIVNEFFGEKITVSGLICGQDLIHQLQDKALGDKLLLPCNMLRSGEDVFLDDVTLDEAKTALQVPVDIVKSSGQDFVKCILNND